MLLASFVCPQVDFAMLDQLCLSNMALNPQSIILPCARALCCVCGTWKNNSKKPEPLKNACHITFVEHLIVAHKWGYSMCVPLHWLQIYEKTTAKCFWSIDWAVSFQMYSKFVLKIDASFPSKSFSVDVIEWKQRIKKGKERKNGKNWLCM